MLWVPCIKFLQSKRVPCQDENKIGSRLANELTLTMKKPALLFANENSEIKGTERSVEVAYCMGLHLLQNYLVHNVHNIHQDIDW